MAKNKREGRENSSPENTRENQPDAIDGEYSVVADGEEDFGKKAKDLASAGAQLAAEYARGKLDAVGDATIETGKAVGQMAVGGPLEGFAGIGKAFKGVVATTKNAFYSLFSDASSGLLPKELITPIMSGFKTARSYFNGGDKKGGDKDKK